MSTYRSLCASFLVLAAYALNPGVAGACSCAEETINEALGRSGAVFEGRVVSVDSESTQPDAKNLVTLRVVRSWKGMNEQTVTVETAASDSVCGYRFEVGKRYLVYATRDDDDELAVSLCSRTQPIEKAGEDLGALGDARPPESRGCKRCTSSVAEPLPLEAASVTLLFLCLVLLRRRGKVT